MELRDGCPQEEEIMIDYGIHGDHGQVDPAYEAWCDEGIKGRHYEGDGRGGQDLTGPEQVMERVFAGGVDEIEAQWSVSLDCECPNCKKCVNLVRSRLRLLNL